MAAVLIQIFLPYKSLLEPVNSILNAPSEMQEELLRKWKDATLFELNFIGILAALLSSVIASALAWPVLFPWSVRAFWFSALLLSLMSISIAAQQAIVITRVSNQEHWLGPLKLLLGKSRRKSSLPSPAMGTDRQNPQAAATLEAGSQTSWEVVPVLIYIWQIPSMLLGYAILVFIIGLAIFLFSNARASPGWGDDQKIGLFFGFLTAFVSINYILHWAYIVYRK